MASAEAIHLAGGPKIAMRYGRLDAESVPAEGFLPDAHPPFHGEKDAAAHLRRVFGRMGFGDREIVALSGAHTLGRAFAERSGATSSGYGKKGTEFTSNPKHVARGDGKAGFGMAGGQAWTEKWLSFDNSYFTQARPGLNHDSGKGSLWLPSDDALKTDPSFRTFYDQYAASQERFFADYADAHRQLSELGSQWAVPGGIVLDFDVAGYRAQLSKCRGDLRAFIDAENCNPILVRLAWHDSGTFDAFRRTGGANGSIRLKGELKHGANAGLSKAVGYLRDFKKKYPMISWADLMQMASAESIHLAGGPEIPMRYGRVDADFSPAEGNLPDAHPPFHGEKDAATHLRCIFYRMGFGDREIVALSGAHTLGRAFAERSGATSSGYGKKGTEFTSNPKHVARGDGKAGFGMAGGQAWTEKWLSFDNSYFTQARSGLNHDSGKGSLWLPSDDALKTDPSFRAFYELYAASKEAFFLDYADAHRQLSELGSRWVVEGGITIPTSKL